MASLLISLEIVVPVLNEDDTLERQVKIIRDFLTTSGLASQFEITLTVSDNGSTDRTPEIARRLAAAGLIKYIRLEKRGVGLALKTAWGESTADLIGYMDLDLATDLQHLTEVATALARPDIAVVYGTRLNRKSEVIGRSLLREFVSRVFNFILRTYLGVKVSDGMCGFKFLKRRYLTLLLENGAQSDGWFFCSELVVIAEWLGLGLYELPVKWTDAPNSKAKIGKLTREYLAAMRVLRRRKAMILAQRQS